MEQKAGILKRITVPRRLMLLLYDQRRFADSFDVPNIVTQAGCAGELNLRQTHVSRALTDLRSEKLVFERSSHVIGARRKKKVYFLTQKGLSETRAFIDEISARKVLVHTQEGELRELTLEKVMKELKKHMGFMPSYHLLLKMFPNIHEIDLKGLKFKGKEIPGESKKLNIPLSRHFYGRKSERVAILDAIEQDRYKFIIIKSIAGQGKTALLINICSSVNNRPVLWITLNKWYKLSNMFNDWAYFLKEHGEMALFNYLGRTAKLNVQDALRAFIQDTRVLKPLFVIDDFHKAEPEINEMFGLITELVLKEKQLVFLISSRIKPEFYGRKDVHQLKSTLELELQGLDKNSSFMILKDKGISEAEFETAFALTRGHPLALELFSPALFSEPQTPNLEFEAFLGEEIIKNLNDRELEVVKLAALMQQPASRSAFFFKPEINQETIDQLCNKLILRSYPDGTYDTHDLIKSYFLNRFSDFEKKIYLKIAINYYSGRSTEKEMLEYIRLLNEADETDRFTEALLEHGEFLLAQGYTQIGEYINDINEEELGGHDSIRLFILKADIAQGNGNSALARTYLDRGLKKCEMQLTGSEGHSGDVESVRLLSRIYNRSAELSKLEGRLDETIRSYREIVKLNKKYGNRSEMGKALNNLALAYRERGELDMALGQLARAREIFNALPDINALALVEVNMGDIYFLKRDFTNANKHFSAAEAASLKYPQVSGVIHGKLGRTWLTIGKYEKAEAALIESLAAYRKTGDVYNQLRCINDLYMCVFVQNSKARAKKYLDDAGALLKSNYGDHQSSEQWLIAKNEHILNTIGYDSKWQPERLQTELNVFIEFHSIQQDPKLILDNFDSLEKKHKLRNNVFLDLHSALAPVLTSMDDKHPMIILGIRHARMLMDVNRIDEAKELLKKLRPVVENIKFKKGLARIDELLK